MTSLWTSHPRRRRGAVLSTAALAAAAMTLAAPLASAAVAAPGGAVPSAIGGGGLSTNYGVVAWQNAAGRLTVLNTIGDNRIHDLGLVMAPKTHPATSQHKDGSTQLAAVDTGNVLWTVDRNNVPTTSGWDVALGTSPYTPNLSDGEAIIFHGLLRQETVNPGFLYPLADGPQLAAGVSPTYWGYEGLDHRIFSSRIADQAEVALGTDPVSASTEAALPSFVSFAWQGPDHVLRYNRDRPGHGLPNPTVNTGLGMMPGTSPAISVSASGYVEIAFQANNGVLWTVDDAGVGHPTGLGMDHASSPSITALPSGAFEIAFQANTHALWMVTNGVGAAVPGATMAPGTSPSVHAFHSQ